MFYLVRMILDAIDRSREKNFLEINSTRRGIIRFRLEKFISKLRLPPNTSTTTQTITHVVALLKSNSSLPLKFIMKLKIIGTKPSAGVLARTETRSEQKDNLCENICLAFESKTPQWLRSCRWQCYQPHIIGDKYKDKCKVVESINHSAGILLFRQRVTLRRNCEIA